MPDISIKCQLPLPYPKISSADLNRYDRQMVRTLLSDKLCIINEYITQSALLAHSYPTLADIVDCIAVSETKHFKLLGRLLLLSGESVRLKELASGCRHSGAFNRGRRVMRTPLDFISANLESERGSVSDYKLVLSQVSDAGTAELLRRILADEEHHADIFANLKIRYS